MAEPAEPSLGCWWRVLAVSLSSTFIVLALLLALAWAVRACADGSQRFSARIDDVRADVVCLSLVGDGPGYVENDCLVRTDIVGLPDDIVAGECLLLTQELHGDLVYEDQRPC